MQQIDIRIYWREKKEEMNVREVTIKQGGIPG